MVIAGHCTPRFFRQGQVLRLQGQERRRQGRHAQVLDPRLEARLFVQDAQATRDRSRQETDPEGDPRCDHHRHGVCRWTACRRAGSLRRGEGDRGREPHAGSPGRESLLVIISGCVVDDAC